ncbi:nucleotidyl transferase AbiEii/AbiGii toxin family protein [Rhizobium leguminosarum bv. viciae]|uniref:Nucleotidyl transferase AbiEii/AbiGii toxin family protein n=6 Tax=Rhizobium TaxID=379 RepID=A0A8I2KJD0_RHILV|nr:MULTISPECIES: nucleotidyl transferase AbiEii/AbiGii toxin family protein [Rhizobium]MBA1344178.1 nucleotidyl transferase AbiEii/AbiGii toxin family protein [Rhizobium sp. WYCCWR 11146]MBX4995638.1 nucleotidyl transferase AbiEii/AbiGii toxin family protein [Rhizobium binae]MBY3165992.1 nucleotidyl transferase AbiEii/AbiGii toxin family protein [Rhizobium laguerreae]MBY3245982.1 nucleotidyl transferase AbiEii/AbiGii toxin family protein [Rhizobium laguerreae]MBY3316571.1 nucleotidyl transfera
MAKEIRNVGASVRARLLQLAKASGQSFDLVLTRFALERLLFRLSQSPHADRFVLKGAMLMMSWFDNPHRGTRDLDLLGFGDPSPDPMLETFREILAQEADDGVTFDADTLHVDRIREALDYGGLRLRVITSISGARINLTIDIGFGDALEPGVEVLDYPSMLDFPMPRLRAYARETVIAEKFQAMVMLGRVNSRMKDFYDIWILSRSFDFSDDRLARAIAATFDRRETPIPIDLPDALTDAFAKDQQKQRQWRAFIEGVAHNPGDLIDVIAQIATFLMPHAVAAARLDE